MFYYNVGYYSMEECPDVTLTHEKQFTQENIGDFLAEYINGNKELPSKEWEYKNNLSDIIFDYETGGFIKFLCDGKGFKRLEYECSYNPFGWADVFDKKDWDDTRDELLNKLTDKLNSN